MTEHEAAKPKRPRDIEFEDAPQQESIRGMSPRTIRRNPSTDQKKVRREMQRKIAGEETELSRLLVEAAATDNPFGDWKCATPGCNKYDGMSAFRGDKYCKSCMKAGEPDKQRDAEQAKKRGSALPVGSPSAAPTNEEEDLTVEASLQVEAKGIAGLGEGDEVRYSHPEHPDYEFKVTYHPREAIGDNGQPASGYVKGGFEVTYPNGQTKYHDHGPFRPGKDMDSKAMVAQGIESDIIGKIHRNHLQSKRYGDSREASKTVEAARPLPTYPAGGVSTPAAKPSSPGDKECASCGHVGAPTLSDTGPACRNCNSYSLKNVQQAKTAINDAEMSQASSERAGYHEGACQHCGVNDWDDNGYCKSCGTHADEDEPEPNDPHDDYYSQGGGHEDNYGDPYGRMDAYHDFKNSSLRAEATQFDTQADKLNPGDMIRTPTGQTVKVLRMRNHETSPGHAYMDTDQGTSVVRRKAPVQIVPFNSQQQQLPGYGTPGGNTNSLPMEQSDSQHGPGGSNVAPSGDCPVCGGKGTLHRQGSNYVCSKCGYRENVGGAGQAPNAFNFTDMPQQLRGNSSLKSAIARRAQEVLDSTEENQ